MSTTTVWPDAFQNNCRKFRLLLFSWRMITPDWLVPSMDSAMVRSSRKGGLLFLQIIAAAVVRIVLTFNAIAVYVAIPTSSHATIQYGVFRNPYLLIAMRVPPMATLSSLRSSACLSIKKNGSKQNVPVLSASLTETLIRTSARIVQKPVPCRATLLFLQRIKLHDDALPWDRGRAAGVKTCSFLSPPFLWQWRAYFEITSPAP